MNWTPLENEAALSLLIKESYHSYQVIFKHSTRCGISSIALQRLERSAIPENASFFFLDILRNRAISNLTAERFQIPHESPQLLLIRNGECVSAWSHMGISMQELTRQLTLL
jgi:bacillithiol system protein YtxJ